jgi:hypothetical protein
MRWFGCQRFLAAPYHARNVPQDGKKATVLLLPLLPTFLSLDPSRARTLRL